jgi:hypothetical protein
MFNISFSNVISAGELTSANNPGRFRGAVYAPNGFVYIIPYDASRILKVNPNTLEIMNPAPGVIPGLDFTQNSSTLWVGGTLAPNNKIYCPSYDGRVTGFSRGILVIDTETDTFNIIPTGTQGRSSALARNGNIYMAPWAGNVVVKVNVNANNITNINIPWNTNGPSWRPGEGGGAAAYKRYWGMVPGPNNKIYGVPYGADRILIVDTENDTITQGEDIVNGGYLTSTNQLSSIVYQTKWSGGTLSPHNNMIYCIPRYAKTILRINTETDRIDELPVNWPAIIQQNELTVSKYFSSVLGTDGRIYCVPWRSNIMMIIDPKTTPETISFIDLPIDPWYAGGVTCPNGKMIFSPWNAVPRRLLALDRIDNQISLDENLILSRWCNNTI